MALSSCNDLVEIFVAIAPHVLLVKPLRLNNRLLLVELHTHVPIHM
jgi:hypothetical protein